jgi:hypothetical protein
MGGGQRHAPAALPPGKKSGTHCTAGWVDPRAILDGCGKSFPTGIRSPTTGKDKCLLSYFRNGNSYEYVQKIASITAVEDVWLPSSYRRRLFCPGRFNEKYLYSVCIVTDNCSTIRRWSYSVLPRSLARSWPDCIWTVFSVRYWL